MKAKLVQRIVLYWLVQVNLVGFLLTLLYVPVAVSENPLMSSNYISLSAIILFIALVVSTGGAIVKMVKMHKINEEGLEKELSKSLWQFLT